MTLALREVEAQALPPNGHPCIVVVDSDPDTRHQLAATLSVDGFDVRTAASGDEGMVLVHTASPALVLVDMELGEPGGLDLFHRIAAVSRVPVIMVTGRGDELDAVLALDAGAADHLTKPARPRELTARVRAVLRRVGPVPAPTRRVGPVLVDPSRREVEVGGRPVSLSRKEFDLLALLVAGDGHVVSRAQCMAGVWGDRTGRDSRTLDTHVKRLRRKIESDPADPRHLVTVRGIGYRLKP